MKITNYFVVSVLCIFITGCGQETESVSKKAPSQNLVPEYQLQALENARGVENMLLEAAEKRKNTMAEQIQQ